MKYLVIALLLIACDYPEHHDGWDTGVDTGEDTDTHYNYDVAVAKIRDSEPCYLGRYDTQDVVFHLENVARGEDFYEDNTECMEVAAEFAYQLTVMGVCPLDDIWKVCLDYPTEFFNVYLPDDMQAIYGNGCRQRIHDNYGCI